MPKASRPDDKRIQGSCTRDSFRKVPGRGSVNRTGKGTVELKIYLGAATFQSVRDEAILRGWPVSRMVRFLVEASIEGIE